ncbi:unnamed protein product [Rotaria socialis]|uniref:Uncharacterized protein n=1 Tax=Rotaria socialis TaxID=392032 RepID=A0A817Z7V6_9BILA|nr:unnamed protein product [Rotaria socialis]CAF4601839.1 unnamed protein product [Rotaria socialis]
MADNTLENRQFQIQKFDSDNAEQLRVIGAGLGRTGTLSLKIALEQLGFGPCHNMGELLSKPRKLIKKWIHDYGEAGPKIHGLHNAQVIKEFKKELLIFNVKEGWKPLCQFLDVPIPKDIPFPNVNDAKHMTRRIFAIQAIGWIAWTLIIVVIAVGIKFISGFVDFT